MFRDFFRYSYHGYVTYGEWMFTLFSENTNTGQINIQTIQKHKLKLCSYSTFN